MSEGRNCSPGRVPIVWGAPRSEAHVAVIAVHGRDQSPQDMVELAARLRPSPVRFYAPTAPGGSWYPRPFLEAIEDNQPSLDESLGILDATLAGVLDQGWAPAEVVLWGFSQGACLSAQYVLQQRPRIGALALFTGGYLGPGDPPRPEPGCLSGTRALLRSIEDDPWVPAYRVRRTGEALLTNGAAVDCVIGPGREHVVTDEAIEALETVLGTVAQS